MFKFLWMMSLPTLLILGCGSTGTKSSTQTDIQRNLDTKSKNYFGYLADATVRIYRLEDGVKNLLFTEKTGNGEILQGIGNFNAHLTDLRPGSYYQFEVSGGQNWDADDDGVKDSEPSANTNSYVALYKGRKLHISWWKRNGKSGTGASE